MEGLQEGRDTRRSPAEREQSVEDSHLQASILQLARGAGGKKIKGDGTAFGYANELIQMWNDGKDVAPVVKDGVVSWVNGVDRTGTRVFYDYDEKGNKVKTKDKELQAANDDAMWTDIEGWLKYANSGSQTRADNIKQSGRIAEYMRAIENGLIDNYDVTKESGETLSLYDYLGELFDLRDQLDEVADVNEASTAARYFSQQYDDIFTRLQSGADVDYNKIGDDAVSLAGYAKRFAGDEQLSSFFSGLSDEYYRLYNRESIKELEAQNQELETALAQAKSDGLAASQGVTWLDSADVIASDEDRRIAEEKAKAADAATREIYDSQMAVQAQIAQLNDEYRNRFMTPEVEAAMQRLSIPELGKAYSKEDIDEYVKSGKADEAAILGGYKNIAEQMRREDQQLVDDWNSGMGFAQQYYNWQDRLAGVSKSFAARTAGSVANIAALATDAVTHDNDQLREAQQARDMAARAYLTDATPENKAALDEAEAALSQAQNDLATGQTERTGAAVKLEDIADTLDENAQAEIAKAKEGASKWGQFGLDLLSTGMDMGFDALTGGGLYTMFARVAGSGIGEARRAGASSEEQLFYGLSKGAIEIATEKLTDGLGAIYGKGISSDVVEKAISRLSSSDAGANFLRLLAGAIGEGGEEVMSDLLDPFTKWVIDEGARDNRTYDVDLSEMLYDFLLGGAMGFLGQGGEAVRGEYATKNAEIREGDAAILEKAENAEATGQQLSKGELRDLEAAQAREAQQGIKGGLVIGPNGGLVIAPGTRAAAKGDNRHDTAVSTLAEGVDRVGYVNSTDADADFRVATTGAQGPRTDAEADQQSYAQEIEAEAERQAEADEAKKAEEAQEAKRKEDAETEKQARIREQEAEGARRAAQAFQDEQNAQLKAAQEAEKYAQLAHNAREFQAEQDFLRKAEQARQAAEEAGRKAEEQLAMAGSQSGAITAQDGNVSPAPANQDKTSQQIADSQATALKGQDTSPVPAPKPAETEEAPAGSETPQGEEGAPLQAETPESPQPPVKLEGNERGEVSAPVATAEQGKASIESGETNNKTVAEVIPMVDKHVSESEPISTVAQNVFESRGSGKTPLSDRVANWIKSKFPAGVHSKAINGNVIVDKRGIKNDIAHGVGEAKAATFAAVPDVLDKGTVVSRSDGSVKGRSVTIAGKVMLNDSPVNVYCVVKQNSGDNRFYLHEVSDGNGIVFYKLGQNNNATPALLDSTGANPASADVASTASIAQPTQSGKTQSKQPAQSKERNAKSSTQETKLSPIQEEAKTIKALSDWGRRGFNPQPFANMPVKHAREVLDLILNVDKSNPVIWEDQDGRTIAFDGTTFEIDGNATTNAGDINWIADNLGEGIESGAIDLTEYLPFNIGNDTIKAERSSQNDSIESGSVPEGNTGTVGRTGEVSESGASSRLQEVLEDSRGDAATHTDLRTANAPVLKKEDAQPEVQSLVDWSEEQTGEECRLHNASVFPDANAGSSYAKGEGLSAAAIHPGTRRTENGIVGGAGTTIVHETVHKKVQQLGIKAADVLNSAYHKIKATEEQINKTYSMVCWAYGRYYAQGQGALSEVTTEQWNSMSPAERKAAIDALPENVRDIVNDKIAEETLCFFISRDAQLGKYEGTYTIAEASREAAVEASLFGSNAFDNIDSRMQMANLVSLMQAQNVAQTQQQTQEKTGRTPGRVKQSQSAFEQDVATKGERANTDAAMGEAEFLSRTNEARSRTADELTDTQKKADVQAQRLLQEDYVWNDDDVVIAQKLMFDMVKAIRDYQLKKNSKLSVGDFRKMTEQYNQLMTKHQEKLSKAGQELQANYMFSTGDKIVMKAAQTFLGFTKDGRFAGASVNAKNAKIYAGIEEASKRIQKAVDAEDVQSLAKICKDISNIRNVKKMFGPLGGFADAMETRVLDKIAKGENAAQNLENLAYGNLNAVCDDVQPYKALNAAKTIRVMNMLSNTATIVNNLANNFAQGAVNRSRVNQALSGIAAKPFAALTGQEVLSKTARGKEARQAVRNAKMEALETATLMQMYGITEENGRLELNDRGLFNPNINAFEQTMSLYKFLTGMGVEATDKMQAAGILKSMELGIDADIKAGKIEAHTKEQRMQEARHEVNRLLYKDDNSTTALVQHVRDYLNKFHVGNDRVGTIGLGDITMAFAKIPANVVRARLAMTPEGALLQVAQYAKGVNKAKRMHAEVQAKGIVEAYQEQIDAANTALQSAYEMEHGPAKDAAIRKAQGELSRLNSKMWSEAQDACRGSVYKNLSTIAGNYNENMMFNEAVERAGYMNAKEMSQFEAAQLSRKIGRAATSAGMMALGSALRALGALRDFDQEPDDELRKMNSDKGYRGLMMNLSAIGRKNHEWKDGDLIIDGEFLEVIAMPLTIGATAAEAAATAQDAKTWSWLKSMAGNGIAKTFEAVGDIPGMADAINMYESLTSAYTTDYDEKTSRLLAGMLQYAANTVPSFFLPNSISQAAAGFDNKVRDVYTADSAWEQAANIFKNKFPGLRNTIPVSVDVWGNERTYGEGLWGAVNKMLLPGDVQVYRKNKYEAEIERMVKAGYGNATPKTTVNSSFEVGDEKYTMTAQEKLDFKAARNSQQRDFFEAFIDSDYYQQLNDAERMKVFQSLKTSAERDAKQDMLDGRQLNVQITRDKWETELMDVNDQIQFLAAKQMANNVLDRDAEDMDYAAVDKYLTGTYKALDKTQRELLDSSYSRLDDMYEAKSSYGIGSEMFNTGYDIYKDYMSDEGRARVSGGYKDWEGSQMYTDIAKATGASEKQMDFFEKKFVLYNNNAVTPEKYNAFVDAGWKRETAQSMVKAVADLTPTNGRKNVSYKQRLTAIATTSGLTEAQRWEAFFEYCPSSYTSVIKSMSRYRSNGFSYAKALKAAKKWDN